MGTVIALLSMARSHFGFFLAVALFSLTGAITEVAGIVMLVTTADGLESRSGLSIPLPGTSLDLNPIQALGLTTTLFIVSLLFKLGAARTLASGVAKWQINYRQRLVNAFLDAPLRTQEIQRAGTFQELFVQHVKIATSSLGQVAWALNGLLGLLVFAVSAFLVDPRAAAVIAVGGAILVSALAPFNRRVRRAGQAEKDLNEEAGVLVDDLVSFVRDIRIFNAQAEFGRRASLFADLVGSTQRTFVFYAKATPSVFQTLGIMILIAALAVATYFGSSDISALAAAGLLLYRGLSYGQQFSASIQDLNRILPFKERLESAIGDLEASRVASGKVDLGPVRSVEFHDVAFAYGVDGDVVQSVNITLEVPDTLALVGPSGSGKSTLAYLLLGLYAPRRGRILVNGRPVAEYSHRSRTQRFALVPQEPILLHASVHDNIAFYREGVTRDDVVAAASAAGLHEMILALPSGYDTLVGASYRGLSGGQKQRIGIARAVLSRPDVIVLDEPTSALDSDAESTIIETIQRLGESTLVVVITHRESTETACRTSLELADGRAQWTSRQTGTSP